MAKGLRIHHPTERNCILIMWRIANPKKGKGEHEIPIHLDENGDSLVCEDIWNYLQEAHNAHHTRNQFVILNEVPDPPTLMLGNESKHVKRVMKQNGNQSFDAQVQAVAQTFAPKGVKARITTVAREDSNG